MRVPHLRSAVPSLAGLALLAFLLQVLAVDHWPIGPSSGGDVNYGEHAQHCHGATGCVDSSPSMPQTAVDEAARPSPPEARRLALPPADSPSAEGLVLNPDEPPRAV